MASQEIAHVSDSSLAISLAIDGDSLQGIPPLQSVVDSPQHRHLSRASSGDVSFERPPSRSSPAHPSSPSREDRDPDDSSISAPVRAMIDFILKSFPEPKASPSHPSSRSFDLSASAGVTDVAIPPGSLLAWSHALSDSFTETQQRFARRIKDGKACHTLLLTLNRFERVSNSPTQGKELRANPDVLDLLRNGVPDSRYVPLSLKEAAALERSLRSPSPQMAGGDRSFCDVTDRKASSVFLTGLQFAGGGDGRSSPALGQSPSLCLSSDRHHKESSCQTEVLEELRVDSHRSVLASEGMVPGPSGTVVRCSHRTVKSKRSKTAPLPPLPSKSAYASADCMATIKRFARQAGFSSTVAGQLVFCRRQSTRLNYQARWGIYRKWCRDFGHRSSSPSISKIAEFLTSLFKRKGAALSTIKGYRAMLSAVFKFPLPEISTSPILKDLIRSFEISAPRPLFSPPPWDLDKVLQYLSGPPFEPLARASFLDKTKKALFLLAMATAKRVSELQALSFSVSFQGEDLVSYYDPFFRAKTESAANPLPRSVIVPSLLDFAGDLPERVQCPVRAIKFLRKAARSASYIPSRLFVSPRNPERAMSKNAISFYLRQLITDSGAVSTSRPPRAHDIRGIATSLNYYSNLSFQPYASCYVEVEPCLRFSVPQGGLCHPG